MSIKRGATLRLTSGIYEVDSLIVEPEGHLDVSLTNGPLYFYSRGTIIVRGMLAPGADAEDMLFASFGTADVTLVRISPIVNNHFAASCTERSHARAPARRGRPRFAAVRDAELITSVLVLGELSPRGWPRAFAGGIQPGSERRPAQMGPTGC